MPFIVIFFLVLALLFVFFLFWLKKFLSSKKLYIDESLPSESTFEFLKISEVQEKEELKIEDKFDHAVIIHGTFVGDDPFHLNQYFNNLFPRIDHNILNTAKKIVKSNNEFFAKDLGNFTRFHEDFLGEKILKNECGKNLVWSSANTHLARVKGLISLIEHIAANCNTNSSLLLLSHSHGGQILALYTQVLKDFKRLKNLLRVAQVPEIFEDLKFQLKKQQGLKFVMVTMGMPVRYKWVKHSEVKLIHIINHRTNTPYGGDIKGVLFSKSGDYVQQWGGAGSDSYITAQEEREINIGLDKYLDIGCDVHTLRVSLESKKRIHNLGHHILIDLEDDDVIPNFYKTIFGHGTYTREETFKNILNKVVSTLNA